MVVLSLVLGLGIGIGIVIIQSYVSRQQQDEIVRDKLKEIRDAFRSGRRTKRRHEF